MVTAMVVGRVAVTESDHGLKPGNLAKRFWLGKSICIKT